jgi:hypothetical protein
MMTEVEGFMRKPMILLAVLIWAEVANAQPQTPKERFLADNPGYKARATEFYSHQYLPGAVRSMVKAIQSPAFRDADATQALRLLIGNFLDCWIEAGGTITDGNREEVVAVMDLQVKRIVKDDKAFDRYLRWRRNSADNPLAFLMAFDSPREQKQAKDRPIRILVADTSARDSAIATRLRKLKFDVLAVAWDKVDPDHAKDIDLIFLATQWGNQLAYEQLEPRKDAFHRFVQRGGGLLASQPNPGSSQTCTPTLLPFPITFHYLYDKKDPIRVNLAHDHFITEDLAEHDLPFPHDTMVKVDARYRVLAKQKSTGSPSLVVCTYGDGRVVVQTNNETYGATIELPDETLRRMIIWAAGREGKNR